jgi:hypothetical protein
MVLHSLLPRASEVFEPVIDTDACEHDDVTKRLPSNSGLSSRPSLASIRPTSVWLVVVMTTHVTLSIIYARIA